MTLSFAVVRDTMLSSKRPGTVDGRGSEAINSVTFGSASNEAGGEPLRC